MELDPKTMMESNVTSEMNVDIVLDKDIEPTVEPTNVISVFKFQHPDCCPRNSDNEIKWDKKYERTITMEHAMISSHQLVAYQIWRSAFVLSDYLYTNIQHFKNERILELAAGIGLTTVAASIVAKEIISTDVDLGKILKLIRSNVERNADLIKCPISVLPLDFFATEWTEEMKEVLSRVTTVIASDVVYVDKLTDAFIDTLDKILSTPPRKTAYVALEKRYDYTVNDLDKSRWVYIDSIPTTYSHFQKHILQRFDSEQIPIDFSQYFKYQRSKELTLWRIRKANVSYI